MFNFSRRINGKTYYSGLALGLLVVIAASLLGELPKLGAVVDTVIGITIILAALGLFVYWICLIRQRANDIGWHPLLLTLLAFSTPLFLIIGVIPGQRAANRYGSIPGSGVKLR